MCNVFVYLILFVTLLPFLHCPHTATVCDNPYFLDILTYVCISACSSGHYHAFEHVIEDEEAVISTLRRKTEEFEFEAKEEEEFEDEERFYDARVCRPCPAYCHSCSGPKQCVQCVSGASFQVNDSSCVPISRTLINPANKNLYIVIIFLLCLSFVFILICRSRPKLPCFKQYTVSYKSLSDGDDKLAMTEVLEYHDDPDNEDLDIKYSPENGLRNGSAFLSAPSSKLLTADHPVLLNGE